MTDNTLVTLKEEIGYEDFCLDLEFGGRGLDEDVVEEQMRTFGEEVLPYIEGKYPNP